MAERIVARNSLWKMLLFILLCALVVLLVIYGDTTMTGGLD